MGTIACSLGSGCSTELVERSFPYKFLSSGGGLEMRSSTGLAHGDQGQTLDHAAPEQVSF